jgi:hypothetical protein
MVAEITSAIGTLGADLLTVGGLGIAISAGIFGLGKGWTVVRRFIK